MEAMIDCDDGFEFEIERVDDFIDCSFDEMNDDGDDDDDEGKLAVFSVEIELNEVGKVDELNDVDGTGEIGRAHV